jgi:transcriptional regulator with XRE-family HTH domain
MANEQTVSDRVASRVKALRRTEDGLTVAKLAARCAELGMPELTAQALHRLEQRGTADRKARPVTVDELFVLARALDVTVGYLLLGEGAQLVGAMTPKALRQMAEYMEQSGISFGDGA